MKIGILKIGSLKYCILKLIEYDKVILNLWVRRYFYMLILKNILLAKLRMNMLLKFRFQVKILYQKNVIVA